jgi:tetratricopeptide (TPR) repeat protein
MTDPAELIQLGAKARAGRNLAAAREFYEEAARGYFEAGDRLLYAHTLRHIADMYVDERKLERARPLYIEALENYRGNLKTTVLDLANAVRPYALLLEASGEIEEARELWREARTLYSAVRVDAGVKECEQHLSQL